MVQIPSYGLHERRAPIEPSALALVLPLPKKLAPTQANVGSGLKFKVLQCRIKDILRSEFKPSERAHPSHFDRNC